MAILGHPYCLNTRPADVDSRCAPVRYIASKERGTTAAGALISRKSDHASQSALHSSNSTLLRSCRPLEWCGSHYRDRLPEDGVPGNVGGRLIDMHTCPDES